MGVRIETITDLLEAQQWVSCADLASQLLSSGSELTTADKAFLNFASCRSLSNLERYSAALDRGQRAAYLAEDVQDFDLLGEILIELAFLQSKIPGLERHAVETQRRYLAIFDRIQGKARRHWLNAQFNLAAYLRSAGEHHDALEQFLKAYEAAKVRKENESADRCRRNAAWQALQLGEIETASRLIEEGRGYVERHPSDSRAAANQLLNEAHLRFRTGDNCEAAAMAVEAALVGAEVEELVADAFDLLHRIGKVTGQIEGALAFAIMAKNRAERAERPEVVNRIRASVRELSVRFPEAVDRFMRDLSSNP